MKTKHATFLVILVSVSLAFFSAGCLSFGGGGAGKERTREYVCSDGRTVLSPGECVPLESRLMKTNVTKFVCGNGRVVLNPVECNQTKTTTLTVKSYVCLDGSRVDNPEKCPAREEGSVEEEPSEELKESQVGGQTSSPAASSTTIGTQSNTSTTSVRKTSTSTSTIKKTTTIHTTTLSTTTTESTTTAPTTTISSENCVYVGSKSSDKYHYPNCRYAKNIKPENKICFSSAEDAKSQGYKPCSVCKPPS